MDAPEASDTRAELADLRRRAYGPGSDIHSDAAALARLSELEEQHRGMDGAPSASASPANSSSVAVLALSPTPVATTIEADADGPASPAVETVSASRDKPASWRRRLSVLALLAVAVLVGVGVGVVLPRLLPAEGPAATVGPIDQGDLTPDFLGARGLTFFGLDEDSLVPYETFGESRAWSGVNGSGAHCIFIDVNGQWMDGGCTPLGLSPMAEYVDTEPAAVAGDPPLRTVVRYVQRADGLIDVWVAPAADSDQ